MKSRLGLLYFLQFGVWGSYLSSFGQLLGKGGLGGDIAWFYAAVGLLALLTPALAGHIADATRKPARILGICHLCAALAMTCCWAYCLGHDKFEFWPMFLPYIAFLAFYMPTIALANTTTFSILHSHGIRPVDAFPSIRIWGTVGFVFAMWFVNCAWYDDGAFGITFSDADVHARMRFQYNSMQLLCSAALGLVTAALTLLLPSSESESGGVKSAQSKSVASIFGLKAFSLFKIPDVRTFLIFMMFMGVCLQISNGYAVPFINHFMGIPEYAGNFIASNGTLLFSLSQISEACCMLLVGKAIKRLGIRIVVTLAMAAWCLRFVFLGIGNPGAGMIFLILSMIVYGIAFNFLTIASHLYMESRCSGDNKGFGQGLVMMMTNGIGATCGIVGAGAIINAFCDWEMVKLPSGNMMRLFMGQWEWAWLIFGAYAAVIGILFVCIFRVKKSESARKCE